MLRSHQKIIVQIHKNVYSKKWQCLESSCQEDAINSHLLQRNGILNTITEQGHLIEIRPIDLFKWKENEPFVEFKSMGIKSAISLPLFCNRHDSILFKNIESKTINFYLYENQLLFSYRTLCSELRKKERNILAHERILQSQTLKGAVNEKPLNIFLDGSYRGIDDLKKYKLLLENELQELKNEFVFVTYEYPLIKVYGSAFFSPIDYNTDSPFQEAPLKGIFIHIVPHYNRLIITVGYSKSHTSKWIEDYVISWKSLTIPKLEEKLTDLFATRIEAWGMSPNLYKNIRASTKKIFIEYWNANATNMSIDQNINFNLFEDGNYG